MADIRKQLKIVATLDDSSFKKQLETFRKEMGKGFKMDFMGQEDLNALKSAFKDVAKDFAGEIKKALKDLKIRPETAGLGPSEVSDNNEDVRQARQDRKRRQQNAHDSMRDQVSKMRVSSREAPADFSRAMDEFSNQERAKTSPAYRAARNISQFPLASTAAGVTATAAGITGFRRTLATRQQGQALDIIGDRGLEGAVRQSGRGLNLVSGLSAAGGALGGAALGAKIGALAGPLGILAGGAIGAIGGGALGYMTGGEAEGETRTKEVRPALEALRMARELRNARVQAFAGGLTPGAVNATQARGTNFGFNPAETLQQLITARQYVGNQTASTGLAQMQEMNRRVGVGVEEQARSAEIFGGAGRAGTARGLSQTVDVLKKGVSAGLDASKSGQFLKTTADFVQSQTGFARLNVGNISENLAQNAFGFARGGEVTQTQLEQSRAMEETIRNMSGTTQGLAGGLNILGAQQTAGKFGINMDAFQTLALAKASNQGEEAIRSVLQETGANQDTIDKAVQDIIQQKQNLPERGSQLLFGNEGSKLSRQIFAGEQLGIRGFSEDIAGFYQARQFQGPRQAGELPGLQQTKELQSLQVEATKNQTVFVEGINLMGRESNKVASELDKAAEVIRRAAKKIEDILGPEASGILRTTN